MSAIRRAVAILFALLFIAALAGIIYQSRATARDRQAHPAAGKLVNVGGWYMHLNCTGEGTPTVLLESGLGDSSTVWSKVQPELARFVRVCSYDRAGLGWSDPSPHGRTSKEVADELQTLLTRAKITGPYILVGHSMGGLHVRMFHCLYPMLVAGMVLVDSSHPDQWRKFPADITSKMTEFRRDAERSARLAPFGIPRLKGWCTDCATAALKEHLAEMEAFDESALQVRTAADLGNLPLVVLSHEPAKAESPPADEQVWDDLQRDLTTLSTNSSRIIANGAGHYIQNDRPDVIIESVRKIVTWLRR